MEAGCGLGFLRLHGCGHVLDVLQHGAGNVVAGGVGVDQLLQLGPVGVEVLAVHLTKPSILSAWNTKRSASVRVWLAKRCHAAAPSKLLLAAQARRKRSISSALTKKVSAMARKMPTRRCVAMVRLAPDRYAGHGMAFMLPPYHSVGSAGGWSAESSRCVDFH